jgi:hypothetical protein
VDSEVLDRPTELGRVLFSQDEQAEIAEEADDQPTNLLTIVLAARRQERGPLHPFTDLARENGAG